MYLQVRRLGTGFDYETYYNALKYQEMLGNIDVVGVTSNQPIYEKVDTYMTRSLSMNIP